MEQRNLVLAIVLSLAILLGFQYFFPPPKPVIPPASTDASTSSPAALVTSKLSAALSAEAVNAATPRVSISTARLVGSINLAGARFDDLSLRDYREE